MGLIILVLFAVNSFTGNPVSGFLAKKAAEQYIDAHYADLHLKVQKTSYNFKFSSYIVLVQSDVSKDTAFNISADSFGKVIRDDYEFEVANYFTTFRRLDSELQGIAIAIIGGKLDYDFDYISLPFVDEADISILERDMVLDIHHPPLPLMVNVTLFNEDVSYNKIAEVGQAIEAILDEQKIPVAEYSIRILPLSDKPENDHQAVSWANSLAISDFPAELMNEKDLPQAMEHFETGRAAELNQNDKQ
ncbi:hypothetical protein [Paenibacillus sp. MMS20-IR301]|uniref:YfjL-like protein n=1 Tax=Paenibacillus sp. MMS20-IR301 TaxID=2895946 RepID=UPI0028EBE380|nr:hypothetical protein [Paenibacillus sp. MMS20-IR301]WNS45290.1 hypothetical protein LOS79_08480 [Paenibacillus sp. MMS20-IR301]